MLDSDKGKFKELVEEACLMAHGEKPGTTQLKLWWNCLNLYDFEAIVNAFSKAMSECIGRLVPAKVTKYLPNSLGHPTAEEAWNYAPKLESDCGYVTDQMMTALCACRNSVERGDMIGARKCFIEVYEREVRLSTEQARFWFSGGVGLLHDELLRAREQCVLQARQQGWLSYEQARSRLERISEALGTDLEQSMKALNSQLDQRGLLLIETNSKKLQSIS